MSKPGRGGNPFTPPPKQPGLDLDISKLIQPGKGKDGSVTLPGGGDRFLPSSFPSSIET